MPSNDVIHMLRDIKCRTESNLFLGLALSQNPDQVLEQASEASPHQSTWIEISSPLGFGIFGTVKSTSPSGIRVLTNIAVPIRCPLDIAIAGCLPIKGEAFYSLKRSSVFQTGILIPRRLKPTISVGAVATIQDLEAPFEEARGGVLDIGNTSLTILCKSAIAPGAWVRIDSSGWLLFGVVRDVVPTSMVSRCLEIHLQAAFAAESKDYETLSETHFYPSTQEQALACVAG